MIKSKVRYIFITELNVDLYWQIFGSELYSAQRKVDKNNISREEYLAHLHASLKDPDIWFVLFLSGQELIGVGMLQRNRHDEVCVGLIYNVILLPGAPIDTSSAMYEYLYALAHTVGCAKVQEEPDMTIMSSDARLGSKLCVK